VFWTFEEKRNLLSRQKTSKSKKAAGKKLKKAVGKAAPSRSHKGRKARTPVEFSPSAKGSDSRKSPHGKKQRQARGDAADDAGASSLSFRDAARDAASGRLRDIVELTFGGHETVAPSLSAVVAASPVNRRRVQDVTQPPWRKICDLLIIAADGTPHSGTGWFISPRTLVTAGHCVFVVNPGHPAHGFVRGIRVMPARNGETSAAQSPFGWVEVPREGLRVHPRWVSNRDLGFDYGAIILPPTAPPLGQQVGFFGFGHFRDQDLDESAPVLSGYPDDVPEGTQWAERNLIKELTPTRVFYDIFTSPGQSGSPVFFRNDNRDIACAIHNFGDVTFNSGVRINPDVVAQLNAWRA
jgi:glutamyl endopeptidase